MGLQRFAPAPSAEGSTRPINSTARFPALDSLRALFVPLMLYHFHEYEGAMVRASWGQWAYFGAVSLGFLGLDVFFALSGFLITGILIDAKHSSSYFRPFYARRFLRIVPAYVLALTLIFLMLPRAYGLSHFDLTGWQIAPYWLFMTNIAMAVHGFTGVIDAAIPFWSVSVEEQFYLVWPIVVYVCRLSVLKRVCIGCLIFAPLLRVVLLFVLHPVSGYVLMPARVDALAAGALVAIWSREPGALRWCARWARPMVAIVVAATIAIFCHYGELSPGQKLFQIVMLTLSPYCAGSLLIIVLTASEDSRLHRLLNARPLRHVARYSYGTYLLHVPLATWLTGTGIIEREAIGRWFGEGLPATIAWAAIMGSISIVAGALCWYLLEAPVLRLKKHFPYGGRAGRAVRRDRAELAS